MMRSEKLFIQCKDEISLRKIIGIIGEENLHFGSLLSLFPLFCESFQRRIVVKCFLFTLFRMHFGCCIQQVLSMDVVL